MLLSIARVVLTTKDDKWLCCKLLTEIVDDDKSKEDTEVTADVPCCVTVSYTHLTLPTNREV